MNDILIDTNVFIYDLDKSSQYNKTANKILNSDNSLFTSSKNISEFFAVLSKFDVSIDLILKYYEDIKQNVRILYPDSKSMEIFEWLVGQYKPTGNRIYDIEIVSVMLSHDIHLITTFNTKDFQPVKEIELFQVED